MDDIIKHNEIPMECVNSDNNKLSGGISDALMSGHNNSQPNPTCSPICGALAHSPYGLNLINPLQKNKSPIGVFGSSLSKNESLIAWIDLIFPGRSYLNSVNPLLYILYPFPSLPSTIIYIGILFGFKPAC